MKDPQRDAGHWLAEAEVDLNLSERIAEEFPSRACFHAQQAGEKALKAILSATGQRRVVGHSLSDLGDAVTGHDPTYGELHDEASTLDRFYIATRYPNGLPGGLPSRQYRHEDAEAAVSTARKVLEHARRFLDERSR